jgi:ABC-type glycerol-3-phosphate transport system permease component
MFVLFVRLNLNNTVPGIIIAYVSVSVPFTVYVLTGFFASLPRELEEAAMIDGCTSFQVFWHVMLPLAQPGLLTAAIFNGVSMWKEFQWALIFVNTEELRTLSLGLYSLKTAMQYSADWAGLYAAVVVVMVPTIILYVFLSEQMIAGITMGSVKS